MYIVAITILHCSIGVYPTGFENPFSEKQIQQKSQISEYAFRELILAAKSYNPALEKIRASAMCPKVDASFR